ncbi:MAG: flagellar protein FlaG [Bdellovibrionales bacterium]
MNIKSVAHNILPLEITKIRRSQSEKAGDRDPNAQSDGGGGDATKRHLSEEEIQKAIAHLKELKGVKDNNLQIRLHKKDGITIVFVEDHLGKVIRRIPEAELYHLTTQDKNTEKGHLLNKSL